jgi:hypothetical protein
MKKFIQTLSLVAVMTELLLQGAEGSNPRHIVISRKQSDTQPQKQFVRANPSGSNKRKNIPDPIFVKKSNNELVIPNTANQSERLSLLLNEFKKQYDVGNNAIIENYPQLFLLFLSANPQANTDDMMHVYEKEKKNNKDFTICETTYYYKLKVGGNTPNEAFFDHVLSGFPNKQYLFHIILSDRLTELAEENKKKSATLNNKLL